MLAEQVPQKSGRFVGAYHAVWALLALTAIAYLGALAWQPELVAVAREAAAPTSESVHVPSADTAAIDSMRDSLSRVESDIAGIKAALKDGETRGNALADRITVIEQRPTPAASLALAPALQSPAAIVPAPVVATPAPAASPTAETSAQADGKPAAAAEARGAAKAGKQAASKQSGTAGWNANVAVSQAATARIETGSLADRPAELGSPSGAPVAVQLATGASVDALRLSWMLLSDRHKNVLQRLEPRFAGEGESLRLIAGPFASEAEALRACVKLKARGVTCRTTEFGGEAL